MKIEQLKEYSDELMAVIVRLLPQLTNFSPIPSKKEVVDIFENPGTTIWVLKDDQQKIAGMLTLVIYKTPTGYAGIIEDEKKKKKLLEQNGCKVTNVYSEKSFLVSDPFGLKYHIFQE